MDISIARIFFKGISRYIVTNIINANVMLDFCYIFTRKLLIQLWCCTHIFKCMEKDIGFFFRNRFFFYLIAGARLRGRQLFITTKLNREKYNCFMLFFDSDNKVFYFIHCCLFLLLIDKNVQWRFFKLRRNKPIALYYKMYSYVDVRE